MGGRINTVMQTCFFYISGVLPREQAIRVNQNLHQKDLRQARRIHCAEELGRRGHGSENMHEVKVPDAVTSKFDLRPPVSEQAPEFLQVYLVYP